MNFIDLYYNLKRKYWDKKLIPTEIVCYPEIYSLRIEYNNKTEYKTHTSTTLGKKILQGMIEWFEDDDSSGTRSVYRTNSTEVFTKSSIKYMELSIKKSTKRYWD